MIGQCLCESKWIYYGGVFLSLGNTHSEIERNLSLLGHGVNKDMSFWQEWMT